MTGSRDRPSVVRIKQLALPYDLVCFFPIFLQFVSKFLSSALGRQSPPSLRRGSARSPSRRRSPSLTPVTAARAHRLLGLTPTAGGILKPVLLLPPVMSKCLVGLSHLVRVF